MKTFLCFSLFILLSIQSTYGQEINENNFTKEYGVNATSFVNTFFSFNDFSNGTNNYLVTYKAKKEDGKFMRIGGNIDLDYQITDPDDNNSGFNKRTNTAFDFDLRIGKEKQFPIKKRWSVNIGMDWILGYGYASSKTDENKAIFNNGYVGAGPIAGFQFMINERIGLLTEGAFYFSASGNFTKSKNDNTGTSRTDKSYAIGTSSNLPTNIIFFMRF